MKSFKPFIISKPAENDLRDIVEYTLKQWGKLQKKSYIGLFKQSFKALSTSQANNVFLPITQVRDEIDKGLMSYRIKKHVVYFRETKQQFLIIRILHLQMDPEKNLT